LRREAKASEHSLVTPLVEFLAESTLAWRTFPGGGSEMAYRLPTAALQTALAHLCRYGDTDVFPHLPELAFFSDMQAEAVTELHKVDLDSFDPGGAIEALAPKSRYGFRIAHQLSALDNVLLLAAVIAISDLIESKRQPLSSNRAFSYRIKTSAKTGDLFEKDRTYKDWLVAQLLHIVSDSNIEQIVSTDISDFYARVNFHRIENLLDEVASGHGAARFVKKVIKIIRSKQSFGLPVGGSAARILAELALIDIDQSLVDGGWYATRFVDDFRILLTKGQSAYDVLGYLAEYLNINEGLSLNTSKTNVKSRVSYQKYLVNLTSDVSQEADGVAIEKLAAEIYFDEDPDPEDLARLAQINLSKILEDEIDQSDWDIGRIKVLFRALKIVKPAASLELITRRFWDLIPFSRELCLLMEAIAHDRQGVFSLWSDIILLAIEQPPASSVQLIRTWLVELFVRGIVDVSASDVKRLEALPSAIDKRQILLIKGRRGDKNFFRRQKTAFSSYSLFERSALVWGASCLPSDEYKNWISAIKVGFDKPTDSLYLAWLSKNKSKLLSKLHSVALDHHD
jgi:hypothetical protein